MQLKSKVLWRGCEIGETNRIAEREREKKGREIERKKREESAIFMLPREREGKFFSERASVCSS